MAGDVVRDASRRAEDAEGHRQVVRLQRPLSCPRSVLNGLESTMTTLRLCHRLSARQQRASTDRLHPDDRVPVPARDQAPLRIGLAVTVRVPQYPALGSHRAGRDDALGGVHNPLNRQRNSGRSSRVVTATSGPLVCFRDCSGGWGIECVRRDWASRSWLYWLWAAAPPAVAQPRRARIRAPRRRQRLRQRWCESSGTPRLPCAPVSRGCPK
jgi:hypothetical protein